MAIKISEKRFIDITRQSINTTSRLNVYNIFRITETNQHFLNHFRAFKLSDDIKNNDRYFDSVTALEDEWWDNISYKYYGSQYYWYLICVVNDVINPYEELSPGQKIKVLKNSYLYEVFRDLRDIAKL